jgi:hypothetical protein
MKQSIGALMIMLGATACGAGVDSDPSSGLGDDDGPGVFHGSSNVCPEADGPRHDYEPEQLAGLMTGKWIHCAGPTPTLLDGSAGVELAADGKYYTLVKDGSGALVRGTGFFSEGTWETENGFVNLHFIPNSYWPNAPLFEDGPRRVGFYMQLEEEFAVYQAVP